jgi:hypothetical protein
MTTVRTARLCSLGRLTSKNVSVMEGICVPCHGKQCFLDTGSSVSTHTQNTTTHTHTCIFLFLKHHYMPFYFNDMAGTAM